MSGSCLYLICVGSRYVTFNITYVPHTVTVFVVEPTTVAVCGVRYVKGNVAPAIYVIRPLQIIALGYTAAAALFSSDFSFGLFL